MSSGTTARGGQRPTGRLIADVVRALRGWVVAVAGGVLLLGAYLGVSKQTNVALQIPYLVSGGMGGMALVILGAALVVADKLEDTRGDSGSGRLARQVDDLHGLIVSAAAADGPPLGAVDRPGPDSPERTDAAHDEDELVAVPSGRSYHRPSCELVTGKPAQAVSDAEIATRGLSPCPVCQPPLAA
ncbi:MAG: hypothetical protein ACQSGP_27840 [Frankia sp.]